ncbi:hypothetical protein BGZ94_003767, partial [Podila epigama]
IISVPPWLMFKGNTIASVCALDAPDNARASVLEENTNAHVAQESPGGAPDRTMEHILDESTIEVKTADPGAETDEGAGEETDVATVSHKSSSPIGEEPHQEIDNPDATTETPAEVTPIESSPGNDEEEEDESVIVSPPEDGPRPIRTSHMYYAKLSAEPGTEEARLQHISVARALRELPGKVVIRHEFGMDADDVLNVISFRLEGSGDGLEQVAAMTGVIGIYPVRTRKRPKSIPLGSLQHIRPTLQSAHILTGVQAVHTRLGLTGKGIKVGIIDTGIDYKHPALGGCFGPGCKVAYGYDFVGDEYDNGSPEKDTPKPDGDPMDCAGHGTHVAGIVAAQSKDSLPNGPTVFVGVAPDATLGAYRVFGCDGEVSDDVLLAALKAAYRDGMDIVNLSLGGASGWPEEPFAMACSAYIRKGLHISIANGNDGEEGLFQDGAPATAMGAIAVGSVDNTHFMGPAADISWQGVDSQGRILDSATAMETSGTSNHASFSIGMAMGADASDAPLPSFRDDITYFIYAPTAQADTGCSPYPAEIVNSLSTQGVNVPRQSIIVLLRRGVCTFNDKAGNVVNASLGGMLVYDTVPEQRPLGMAISGLNISAAGLSFEDATLILNALKQGPGASSNGGAGVLLTARFSNTSQVLPLASGGKISDFSSWGPDARLRYKPDIVSPGGMIFSTFPLAKGGFSTLQGTSMASPYMAGVQALYLARHGKTDANKLLSLLQSTAVATVRPGSRTSLTSVFQQGGGLIALERLFAIDPPTVVTPTVLYLNDTQFQRLEHRVTFFNPSKTTTRTWRLVHRPASSVNGFEETNFYSTVNQSRLRMSEEGAMSAIMDPPQLTLAPGQSGAVLVRISPPRNLKVEERWLYSGFLNFTCTTSTSTAGGREPVSQSECDSSLVSYGGMHGHLSGIPILNPALTYPALQLDRYVPQNASKPVGTNPRLPNNGTPHRHHHHSHHRQRYPNGQIRLETNALGEGALPGKVVPADDKSGGGTSAERKIRKNLFRDQKETVHVGKSDQDWVQILISVNFPTGLLTIEVENVCDEYHSQGSGRVRLEMMGGSGQSRFQIESEEELAAAKKALEASSDGDANSEELELIKERLAISEELAFMPSGLYMPYQGYSSVMVKTSGEKTTPSDQVVQLHREKKSNKGNKSSRRLAKQKGQKTRSDNRDVHMTSKQSRKPNRKQGKKEQGTKNRNKNKKKKKGAKTDEQKRRERGRGRRGGGGGSARGGQGRNREVERRPKTPLPAPQKERGRKKKTTPCVPRILGLIPNGYNPWSTRTDSSEGNSVQAFSWMGDLLLENPDVV